MDQKEEKSWLERLQRESWELELLISGFILIMLFQLPGALEYAEEYLSDEWDLYIPMTITLSLHILFKVLLVMSYILIFHFVLHVITRGFWVGVIGLKSVIKIDLNINDLNFNAFYKKKLKSKLSNLKELINSTDNFISQNFAFTFLVLYVTIGVVLVFIVFIIPFYLIEVFQINENYLVSILIEIWYTYLIIGSFLTFIDFISLGVLKKGFVGKLYYYLFYKFFRLITLSFAYNPIYYSFTKQGNKRWLGLIISCYIFFGMYFMLAETNYVALLKKNVDARSHIESSDYSENENSNGIQIQSLIVNNNYLKLFVPIFDVNDTTKKGIRQLLNPGEVYLNDSLCSNIEWHLTKLNENKTGLLSLIDIRGLKLGKNILTIKYINRRSTLIIRPNEKTAVSGNNKLKTKTIVFYKDS